MYQHFAEVHQYPLAAAFTLAAKNFFAALFELDHHIVGQRFGLPGGIGAGDDHAFEHRTEFAGVDHGDVLCFDVFKCGDDGEGFFFSS